MINPRSFVGPPTTNLVYPSTTIWGGLWTGYCAGNMNNVTPNTTEITAPDGSFTALKIVRDSNTSCGAAGTWGMLWSQSATFTSGQTYTVSIWARSSGGSVAAALGMNDSFMSNITLTSTWQRFTYTTVITSNLDRGLQFTIAAGAGTCYFWGAQLEQQSFATPYVATSSGTGTRSNTQAILDLTGNNTITATSAQYASNNTYSFNGTTDSFDLGKNSYTLGITRSATYSCWVKPTSTTAMYGISDYGTNALGMTLRTNNNTSADFYVYPNNHRITYTYAFDPNIWYNLVGVMDNANMYMYFNGQLVGTTTLGEDIGNSSNTLKIGSRGDGPAVAGGTGYASGVQIYNRALTANEVAQNFNALRGRYGV
jgi:hypothetical protein